MVFKGIYTNFELVCQTFNHLSNENKQKGLKMKNLIMLTVIVTAAAFILVAASGFYNEASCGEHPTSEHPKAEEPKADNSSSEHPKAENPKAEHPKADEHSTIEHPKAEQPKADNSSSEHPE